MGALLVLVVMIFGGFHMALIVLATLVVVELFF
mgnify:CR=1 FL=1